MITVLVIGFILGASLVATPLIIQLFSQYGIEDNVESIREDLDVVLEDNLNENQYKISGKPDSDLENVIVEQAKRSIRKQHIVNESKDIMVSEVVVKPDEWVIKFEVSE